MTTVYPPGHKGNFLTGNAHQFNHDRLGFLMYLSQNYGDIVHFNIGPRHVYLLNHPDYIRYVLVEHPDKFNKTPAFKKNTRHIIGEGLLTSDGEFHKRQRRLVQPAFHHQRIASYAAVMVSYTQHMLDGWQIGETIDVAQEMMRLTMSIVAKTLFDADVSSNADALGKAIALGITTVSQRMGALLRLPDWLPTRANMERREANELMQRTIMKIIEQRRLSGEDKGDLLSMLLTASDADGSQMSDQQVYNEVMTLFIAGHETTANTLAWALYLLAQHAEIEIRLISELDDVLEGRLPKVEDLDKLRYAEMIIKESMRLYPPAWIIGRVAIEEIAIGGYTLAKGSIVLLSPYVMHHSPRYFDQPEVFRPERFAEGEEILIPRYTYFPFGGGPRVCIGQSFAMMEAVLVLATIMQRHHLTLASDQKVKMDPLVTLRPGAAGIEVIVNSQHQLHYTIA